MANAEINKELAATVLIEAAYTTDEKAAARYGISLRTIQRWRSKIQTDPILAGFVATKKRAFDEAWAEEIPVTLRKAMRFLNDAFEKADARNPAIIESVVGAIKIIAEVQMTGRWIDARIGNQDRAANQLSGQGDSADEANSASGFVS